MAEQMAHFTNAVQAFHEAGPEGVKVLLSGIEAPVYRVNQMLFELGNLLQRRGWFQNGRPYLLEHPQERVFAVHQMIHALPPVSDESFHFLLQEFARVASELKALSSGRSPEGADPYTEKRSVRQGQLSAVAGWICRNGNRGVGFLTNQLFESSDTGAQEAVLHVFGQANLPDPVVVPALIHAAENPALAYLAAQFLTDLRREPAVALPALTREAAKGNVAAAALIGDWGTYAEPWLPAILPLTTNADPQVSFQAGIAVRKIRGE